MEKHFTHPQSGSHGFSPRLPHLDWRMFPQAIRIADRFHVHGYVIESVQEVRKTVQSTLSPRAKAQLKAHHRLLNPPADTLTEESQKQLEILLNYSPLLRQVWE